HRVIGLALLGWLGLSLWAVPRGSLQLLDALVCLGPLVVVPLGLTLIATPDRHGVHRLSYVAGVGLTGPAALCVLLAFFLPTGTGAGLACLPWLVTTCCLAAYGAGRFLSRGSRSREETCIDVGLLYLPIGAAWLLASRAGLKPMGFGEPIVELTAAHFHYAGFAALVLCGLVGRTIRRSHHHPAVGRLLGTAEAILIPGPFLVALGISISPLLEVVASVLLALAVLCLASLFVGVLPGRSRGWTSASLGVAAGLTVFATMVLACMFAWGEYRERPILSIDRMVLFHGLGNAVGFALLGLLSMALDPPRSRGSAPGVPFSRIRSGWNIGEDFFEREGLVDHQGSPVSGLVDDLSTYKHPEFEPGDLAPDVRAFYEETDRFAIYVRPHWHPSFAGAARLWRWLSGRWNQTNLPRAPIRDAAMKTRMLPLDDRRDGRQGVRAWIRTYRGSGQVVYAAAYSTHHVGDRPYMNIAFPLLWGHMSSILRIGRLDGRPAGLQLSSLHAGDCQGDQGVYFVLGSFVLRLPIDETIEVAPAPWAEEGFRQPPPEAEGASVLGLHRMWVFGFPFLSLEYWLDKIDSADLPEQQA
ncbi:MAG: YndJ family protein, partial [Myxococcota bacterium]|nr:YndJ family protein [Myxococcota bacterium]